MSFAMSLSSSLKSELMQKNVSSVYDLELLD